MEGIGDGPVGRPYDGKLPREPRTAATALAAVPASMCPLRAIDDARLAESCAAKAEVGCEGRAPCMAA